MKYTYPVLLSVLLLFSGCSGSKTSSSSHGAVWSDGTWLRDTQGRVIIVHGVNVSETAKHPPYLPFTTTAMSDQAADQYFSVLKGLGLDAVRLLVFWAALEPTPGTIDTGYLDQLQKEVQMCADNGLWVLLDMHQDLFSESFCYGDGAPPWACDLAGYDVSQCTIDTSNANVALWGLNYTLPQVRQSFQDLWDDRSGPDGTGLQEHYLTALQALARRFGTTANVLGYDIMNEPYPGLYPLFTTEFEQKALVPFYEKMVEGIRTVDPDHVIAFEATNPLCSVFSDFETGISQTTFPRQFPNLLFEPHFYPVDPVDVSSIVAGLDALRSLGT
ncbi:MAG: glycoside hydrolase family 5 protein, partial [Deltaproteobacteria bacterium]|nr:glycoside hydrolase family 5 protein [Deltaproteobacteria bacterium]